MATLFRPVPVPVRSHFPAFNLSVVPAAKVGGGNTKISTTAPDSGCSLSLCFPAGLTTSSARKFKYICCAGPEFGDNYKKPIVIEFEDDPVYDLTIAKISFVVGVFIDAALVGRAVNEALETVEFVVDGIKSDIISDGSRIRVEFYLTNRLGAGKIEDPILLQTIRFMIVSTLRKYIYNIK